MGLLADLSNIQETYRGLFRDLYQEGGNEDVDEDAVVAVAVAHFEMAVTHSGDPYHEPTENDVLAAMEFIDHLDTLGKQVIGK